MFKDFEEGKKTEDAGGRGRMGVSLAVSAVIYLAIGVGVVAAVATAKVVVDRKDKDIAVEFAAQPTQPEQKKEKPKPKPKPKPKEAKKEVKAQEGQRRGLSAPTEIPDEVLEEATSGRLADVEEINIDEMIGDEGTGKKKTGPRQVRETVSRPQFIGGCRAPDVPIAVRDSAETIRVRVRILVMPDGVPFKAEMEQSHPAIPDESILKCALAQRFEPARLPDGTAVPYPYRRQFTFKPSNI